MTRSKTAVNFEQNIEDYQSKYDATNHGKRWTENEDKLLNDLYNSDVITHNDIWQFARSVNRTYGAIKSRMLSTCTRSIFDYENNNNEFLFKKFRFATEEDIEYYALRILNKRDRKLFKLNKLEKIINVYANNFNETDAKRIQETLNDLKEQI